MHHSCVIPCVATSSLSLDFCNFCFVVDALSVVPTSPSSAALSPDAHANGDQHSRRHVPCDCQSFDHSPEIRRAPFSRDAADREAQPPVGLLIFRKFGRMVGTPSNRSTESSSPCHGQFSSLVFGHNRECCPRAVRDHNHLPSARLDRGKRNAPTHG
jgi:hypothetical protein